MLNCTRADVVHRWWWDRAKRWRPGIEPHICSDITGKIGCWRLAGLQKDLFLTWAPPCNLTAARVCMQTNPHTSDHRQGAALLLAYQQNCLLSLGKNTVFSLSASPFKNRVLYKIVRPHLICSEFCLRSLFPKHTGLVTLSSLRVLGQAKQTRKIKEASAQDHDGCPEGSFNRVRLGAVGLMWRG